MNVTIMGGSTAGGSRRYVGSVRKEDKQTEWRLLIFAKDQLQRDEFLRAETLNGGRISTHIPGYAAKLRGVIYDVPLAMMMDEVIQEVKEWDI